MAKMNSAALTRDEMIKRAWALVPALQERATETEQLGRIHPDTVKDFHDSRLWRVHQPKRYGGLELDFTLYIDIGEALGRGCGSTAWVWANLAAHDWMLGMFPVNAQDEIWHEDPDTLIGSALIYPCGKTEIVDGGYRLSGRWPFSSGIAPCDWAMLGGMVQTDDGAEPYIFNVRRKDMEVIETWDVSGLVGTGSEDVACEDVFVPNHMALPLKDTRGGPTPGSAVNSHPLYQVPLLALFPHVIAGVLLGIARAAFDDCIENTKGRIATYNQAKLADYTNQQMRISEAGASIDAARLLLRDNCLEAERTVAETGSDIYGSRRRR